MLGLLKQSSSKNNIGAIRFLYLRTSDLSYNLKCNESIGPRASELTFTPAENPSTLPPLEELRFGRVFSPHFLNISWSKSSGWSSPVIESLQPLSIHPGCTGIQYAASCFEGMKTYKDEHGRLRLFRPEKNMARLQSSVEKLFLPSFDESEVLECIKRFVLVEKDWIPPRKGFSLYLRPNVIGTTPFLGVGPSNDAMLYVLGSPCGPYYPEGMKPIGILVDDSYVRAWPDGCGDRKVAGNYGPTIVSQDAAQRQGYSQCLFLIPRNGEFCISECGAMNIFFLLKSSQTGGSLQLVTPPLDGTILPGVTRDSILALSREWGIHDVSERHITVTELTEGEVVEAFGCGTACTIQPIGELKLPSGKSIHINWNADFGYAGKLKNAIEDIQYGVVDHPWSTVISD